MLWFPKRPVRAHLQVRVEISEKFQKKGGKWEVQLRGS